MTKQILPGKDGARRRRAAARPRSDHIDERTIDIWPIATPAMANQRTADPARVLAMQRTVGNATTATRLRKPAPVDSPTIRRHSSWEHALLGDTPPKQLGEATVPGGTRIHILSQEWMRIMVFIHDPGADPRAQHPDVRWLQLKESKLWVSYGELNALADYLPDPSTIDTLPRGQMVPVLQRMRRDILEGIRNLTNFPVRSMKGAAMSGLDLVPGMEAAAEVSALDDATAGLGTQRYSGLLARNACHFAPFSWDRWALFHNQAREEARKYHASKTGMKPLKDVGAGADDHLRQALLNNGYGDHFLQDSFAAGHLVNKTLVMQWFAEYLNSMPWILRPSVGVPGSDTLGAVSEKNQPGIAGRDRYNATPGSATSQEDRILGNSAIDPQSAQERWSKEGRMAGSGVVASGGKTREENYQAYLEMLNSSYLQLASGAAHDYFNKRGLWVANKRGDTLNVGGDDTLLAKSGPLGAQIAGEAAHRSQQAIEEILQTGESKITLDEIFAIFPTEVYLDSDPSTKLPLSQWQDAVVKRICWTSLFPDLVNSFKGEAVRTASSKMVGAGISPDQ